MTSLRASSRKSVTYMMTGILAKNFCNFSGICFLTLVDSFFSNFSSSSRLFLPFSRWTFFNFLVSN